MVICGDAGGVFVYLVIKREELIRFFIYGVYKNSPCSFV